MRVRLTPRPITASASRTFFRPARDGVRRLGWLTLLALGLLSASGCRRRAYLPQPYVAFVANHQSHTVAAVDLANFRLVAAIPVAPNPEQVVVRPGSLELYVVSAPGTVSVISIPERRVTATLRLGGAARSLVFSSDGK